MKHFVLGASLLASSASATNLSDFLNARSNEKEVRLYSCACGYVGEDCKLSLETSGYGGVLYAIFQRLSDGRLVTAKVGRLDPTGKATLNVKFKSAEAVNFVAVLFERNVPVALDGVMVTVYPDRNQLGEQVQGFSLDVGGDTDDETEDVEPYDPTPPYLGPLRQGE